MKTPRDISGAVLVTSLEKAGFTVTRQTGSHVRLEFETEGNRRHLTVPLSKPLKIGTLNAILKDICETMGISKEELYALLGW